jgi:DNA-binding MarR family transcriptional regulator
VSNASRTETKEALAEAGNPSPEPDTGAEGPAVSGSVADGEGIRGSQVIRPAAERRNARLSLACNIYQARLDRALFFRGTIFSDIAWDTLLAVYVFGAAGRTLSAGELARAVVESSTTSALRMQRRLVDLALIRRVIDPDDKRRVLIELTEEGSKVLEDYLDHALERRIVPVNADAVLDPGSVQWLGRKYARAP